MKMRTCPRCEVSFPRNSEYFYRNSTTKDGLAYYCKSCHNYYNMKSRKNNKPSNDKYVKPVLFLSDKDKLDFELGDRYMVVKYGYKAFEGEVIQVTDDLVVLNNGIRNECFRKLDFLVDLQLSKVGE